MKHLKFSFAEPVAGIQRVRNEVFLSDGKLLVSSKELFYKVDAFVSDEVYGGAPYLRRRVSRYQRGAFYEYPCPEGYHFESSSDGEEILLIKGENSIWVEDELGNCVKSYLGTPGAPCRIPDEKPIEIITDENPLCWDER